MIGLRQIVGLAVVALVAASCGGATGSPAPATTTTAPAGSAGGPTGTIDCTLLTAPDFTTVGITGAGSPTDNPDGTSHYCVYAGTSGATGGIEFDVFLDDSVENAKATYETMIGEGPNGPPPAGATFDQSSYGAADGYGVLAVRQGPLSFALSAPDSPGTQAALVALAALVIARAGAAASP